jgi:hypothetical protein
MHLFMHHGDRHHHNHGESGGDREHSGRRAVREPV